MAQLISAVSGRKMALLVWRMGNKRGTINAVCVDNKKDKTELKAMCDNDDEMTPCLFLKSGCHFSFQKKAGRHQKWSGCCALQKTA